MVKDIIKIKIMMIITGESNGVLVGERERETFCGGLRGFVGFLRGREKRQS